MPMLLICTIGGSPEPIVASLKSAGPERVWFVVSPQTESEVGEKVLPRLSGEGTRLSPGQYELLQVPDAQDLSSTLSIMRHSIAC